MTTTVTFQGFKSHYYRIRSINWRTGQGFYNTAKSLGFDLVPEYLQSINADCYYNDQNIYRFLVAILGKKEADEYLKTPFGVNKLKEHGVLFKKIYEPVKTNNTKLV